MKNLLKYGILAISAIAAMSCAKELDSTVDSSKKVQLLIPAETVTKTSFNDEMKLQWNNDDKIGIYIGETTKNVEATLTRVDGKAYFTATVAEYAAGDLLYAYYPYDAANAGNAFNAVTLAVKNSQVQTEATVFNGSNNPMVAVPVALPEVGTALSESLKFRHIASIVQFDIFDATGAHAGETVKMVQFSTNGLATANNAVTYDLSKVTEEGELTPISGNANYRTVTVSLKSESTEATGPVSTVGTAAGSSLVYMMIVPGTYTGSFYVTTDKGVYRYADRNLTVAAAEMPRYKVDLSKGNSSKEILSAADYECFATSANAGDYSAWKDEDGQVKLGADIAAAHEFTRIQADWDGIFNGQNHSITQPATTVPLFTKILADAKVCNLVLEGACKSMGDPGNFGTAPLAQLNFGTIENVTNKINFEIDYSNTGAAFSGMVKLNAGTMSTCTNEGNLNLNLTLVNSNMTAYAGGLADYASDSDGFDSSTTVGKFVNCTNKGDIIVKIIHNSEVARAMQKYAIGGICATVHFGDANNFTSFENCKNEGTISSIETGQKTSNGAALFGGIVGKISNTTAKGTITAVNVASGYYAELKNCTNTGIIENGSISAGQLPNNTCARACASGGIVGYANGMTTKPIEITGCTNTGIMKGGCSEAAGIGGLCGQTNYVNISDCTVDAKFVDSDTEVHQYAVLGGIVGMSLSNTKASNCYVCINTDLSVGPLPEYKNSKGQTFKGNLGVLQGYAKKTTDSYDNIKVCGTLKYGETTTAITESNVAEPALLGPTALKATNITYWTK